MKATKNKFDKNIFSVNYDTFSNVITDLRIEHAKEEVNKSNFSSETYKMLICKFVQKTQENGSKEYKNQIADMINAWHCELYSHPWHTELIAFCKEKQNIHSAYFVSNKNREEFIIVMDDSTDESVLDYNEFGFYLKEKFNTIHDFMVLDVDMLGSINSMFEKNEKIYERRI